MGLVFGLVWAVSVTLSFPCREPYLAEIPSWERNEEKDVDELARSPAHKCCFVFLSNHLLLSAWCKPEKVMFDLRGLYLRGFEVDRSAPGTLTATDEHPNPKPYTLHPKLETLDPWLKSCQCEGPSLKGSLKGTLKGVKKEPLREPVETLPKRISRIDGFRRNPKPPKIWVI